MWTSPTSARARWCWTWARCAAHLFVLIKGYVTQHEGDEVVATYGPDDCFDGRGLVAGQAVSSRFVAAEEVVAYAAGAQPCRS
jgi:CBS domain-containing protein